MSHSKEESAPSRQTMWNVALTIIGTAILTVVGWLALEVVNIKSELTGTRFTNANGADLREDITDVTTDIDTRLRVMENNIGWIREIMTAHHGEGPPAKVEPREMPPAPEPPKATNATLELKEIRRYDVRQRK